ncbi:hypothetical protein O181_061300 [Austropuccinia psidii MF-1]|uniref:BAR-domain-containing protein n=1 Tax=Austropuccinia psidii MF-1 TaxID=1389203 RepID=A0A9Q3EM39_9BASI|nr:hypothetical protein [Austropuccinia psidii MF-1]
MKVNKRIGKLKQWTGEKLGGQQKTELSEDFQSLEQDVELRKVGVDRLYIVSKEYSKHMTKKIDAEGTDTGKVLPIDALGLVFASHGDEFGHDSAFGQALVDFGKAQQQIAIATANFTDHLNSGWLTSLEKSIAQMAEYANQRKKLDSRRLTYDAMLAKVQKSKKEKRELEDDLRVAKNRYEETSEEVQERAIAIQDSEAEQLIALTRLLEIESNWVDEQKRLLDDLKKNWVEPSAFKHNMAGRKKGTAHTFGIESSPPTKPSIKAKTLPSARKPRMMDDDLDYSRDQAEEEDNLDEDDDDSSLRQRRTQKSSASHSSFGLKPRSSVREPPLKERPLPPPLSNQNSNGRFGGVRIPGMPPTASGAQSEEDSVSPTMETHRRQNGHLLHQFSNPSLRRSTTVPPSSKSSKRMRAKWAYNPTETDELELAVGDRVKVTSEINSEWFIGKNESTGRSGMFPAAYCIHDDQHSTIESDTFADQYDEDDEDDDSKKNESEEDQSEGAALRPSRPVPYSHRVTPSGGVGPSREINSSGKFASPPSNQAHLPSGGTIGKRPPPPPPIRRSTVAGSKPSSTSPNSPIQEQPEAFGSVSELKKRLGMFK